MISTRNTELERATPHGLVYLHTGRVDPSTGELRPTKQRNLGIDFKAFCTELGLDIVRAHEDIVEAFNNVILDHRFEVKLTDPDSDRVTSCPIVACLREIHTRGWYEAVRYYSWSQLSGQLLSKDERKLLRIDKEPVTELDFSASQLRMLYHLKGLDPKGDLYRPDLVLRRTHKSDKLSAKRKELLRDFVKRATLTCLNVKSRSAAHSSVGKWIKEHPDRGYFLTIIKDVERTSIKGIVKRILEIHERLITAYKRPASRRRPVHPDRCEPFFNETGLKMMSVESKVMKQLLIAFSNARKPALMIHDAVVCKASDADFTKHAMTEAYQYVLSTDFLPVIKQEF